MINVTFKYGPTGASMGFPISLGNGQSVVDKIMQQFTPDQRREEHTLKTVDVTSDEFTVGEQYLIADMTPEEIQQFAVWFEAQDEKTKEAIDVMLTECTPLEAMSTFQECRCDVYDCRDTEHSPEQVIGEKVYKERLGFDRIPDDLTSDIARYIDKELLGRDYLNSTAHYWVKNGIYVLYWL